MLIETTTAKINKKKVAQLTVRKAEYAKKNDYFPSKPEIKLIIVSPTSEPTDVLANKEAGNNSISIIGRNQMEELLKMLSNGTLNQSKFLEYIKKCIPILK